MQKPFFTIALYEQYGDAASSWGSKRVIGYAGLPLQGPYRE